MKNMTDFAAFKLTVPEIRVLGLTTQSIRIVKSILVGRHCREVSFAAKADVNNKLYYAVSKDFPKWEDNVYFKIPDSGSSIEILISGKLTTEERDALWVEISTLLNKHKNQLIAG